MARRHTAATLGLLALLGAGCHRSTFADRVETPDWPEFSARVKSYTELADRADKDAPPLPDEATPEQIKAHKDVMADRVRQARSGARPKNVFGADRDRFVRVVRSEVRGPEGLPTKSTIAEDDPSRGETGPRVTLAVNGRYPDGAPLSTVPPTILLRLPSLPKDVEYRFVGKALVLHDARANIIVDFIPNALI